MIKKLFCHFSRELLDCDLRLPWKSFIFVTSRIRCKKRKKFFFTLKSKVKINFAVRSLHVFIFRSNRGCKLFFSPCTYVRICVHVLANVGPNRRPISTMLLRVNEARTARLVLRTNIVFVISVDSRIQYVFLDSCVVFIVNVRMYVRLAPTCANQSSRRRVETHANSGCLRAATFTQNLKTRVVSRCYLYSRWLAARSYADRNRDFDHVVEQANSLHCRTNVSKAFESLYKTRATTCNSQEDESCQRLYCTCAMHRAESCKVRLPRMFRFEAIS